jgi:hypothetical protein
MKKNQFVLRFFSCLLFLIFVAPSFAMAAPLAPPGYMAVPQGLYVPYDQRLLDDPASWGSYVPTYYGGDTSIVDLQNKPLLFLTHHSSNYDRIGIAEQGAQTSLSRFLGFGYPIFYLYSFRFASESTFRFLPYFNRMTGVESEGGENTLRYRGSRKFFFTGGHFSLCLCETIRDTMRNVVDASETEATHFYFITDGIYDAGETLKARAAQYKSAARGYAQLVLQRLGQREAKNFCLQNWKNQPEVAIGNYRIDVENYDGQSVRISNGSKGNFVFHLIESTEIESVLNSASHLRQWN